MIPIILSGGSGTRLWPLSRKMYPKQFLSLLHDETMLQRTLQRLEGIEHSAPIVVCNNEHRFVVAEQARQIGIEDLTVAGFGYEGCFAVSVVDLKTGETIAMEWYKAGVGLVRTEDLTSEVTRQLLTLPSVSPSF